MTIKKGPRAGKTVTLADQHAVTAEKEAIDALLRLLGHSWDEVLVTDLSQFSDFGIAQDELDMVMPVQMHRDTYLIQAVGIIRESIPGWPNGRAH